KPGVLGLLGPNGAGKSTLMRILATVTRPSTGSIHWNDLDILSSPDPLRAVLGYLPQDFGVYPHLTAYEFLEYLAAVKGLDGAAARRRVEELLVVVNLSDARHRPLGGFSGGMRQRVGIAQALLNDPQLLIVDEPTAGLDPEERVRFRNLLSELSGERIVILSTHIVSDVEAVATDIAILNHGLLLAHDSPESLLAAISGRVWEIVVPSAALSVIHQQHRSSQRRRPRSRCVPLSAHAASSTARAHPGGRLSRFHRQLSHRCRGRGFVNIPRVVFASARADFLERIRRYSFLFTLGLALYFGYLAAIGRIMLRLNDTRGVYDSAWVGALLTIVGSTFISLAGFYFVKNTIQRDRETRVGEILASAPLSKLLYILSKVLSNFAVLSLMIVILALSAIVMQLVRGEDPHIQLWKLLAPFLFLAIPVMAVVAAVAVLFETIPFLRGGLGNVAYFFLWAFALSMSVIPHFPASDLAGIDLVKESTMAAAHLSENAGFTFSLDAGQFSTAAATFRWDGISWTWQILLARIFWLGIALAISLLAATLFDRFDPARGYRSSPASPLPALATPISASSISAALPIRALTPLSGLAFHARFLIILSAEIRLLLKGQRWWWYLVVAGFIIA